MSFPWSVLAGSLVLSFLATALLMPVARSIGWVDKPSVRKDHQGLIPLIGGWAILITLAVMQFIGPAGQCAPLGYWLGGLLLFSVALVDDRFPIRARWRAMVQVGAAVAAVGLGGRFLPSVGDVLGVGLGLGLLSNPWVMLPLSLVGTVAVINAVNFTDGADGLCGGLSFISLMWFAVALVFASQAAQAAGITPEPFAGAMVPMAAALMGGLAGFLWFNLRSPLRSRAAVFLGDSGSMLLGFTLAWFAIHATSAYGSASVKPVVSLWIVAVPLADSASCIVRRIRAGVTPMTPDLKHLHHLVVRLGLTPGQGVFAIHVGSFLCGLVGVGGWLLGFSERALFGTFVLVLLVFIAWSNLAWARLDGAQKKVTADDPVSL
ncbi:MAG: MraY family glycosyltransferase [Lautropia sp.]|nr:MraY family glycosyltransferase [Lautropia sp.]